MSSSKEQEKTLFGACQPNKNGDTNCCNDHTVLPDSGPPDPQRYCNKAHGSTFQEGTGYCGKYWMKVNNTCTAADYIPIFGVPRMARIASFGMDHLIGEQVETIITYPDGAELINTADELFILKPETGEICVKCDGFYHIMHSVGVFDLDEHDWRMYTGGFLNSAAQYGRKFTSGTGHPGQANAPIFTVPTFYLAAGDCVSTMAWTDRSGGISIELAYVSIERIY